MRYIRRIDDPLKIKAHGFVSAGGLGAFDPAVYEEVEGELPDGWEQENLKTLNQKLEEKFLAVLPAHIGQPYMTNTVIRDVMQAKVAIIEANNLNQPEFAKAVIQALSVPSEMEADKQELIDIIDNH